MAKLKGKTKANARKAKRNAYKQSKNCMVLLPNGGFKMITQTEFDNLFKKEEA
jgi:hypothetical protein